MDKQTLMVTAVNRPDFLARISGLLSAKMIRIESINGRPAKNPNEFKIRLVVSGTEHRLGQASRLIDNLIDTIKVVDVPNRKAEARAPARRDRRSFPVGEVF